MNLTGAGVTIAEWDGGAARTTHQEFGGRATIRDGAAIAWHSTHVAGTLIGSGVDGAAEGMAWGALLNAFDWTDDEIEMANEASVGLRLSNHSYGYITGWRWSGSAWYWYGDRVAGHTEDAGFGYYDDSARDWDDIAYNHPYYLIFKSAGNDRLEGPDTQPIAHYEWNGTAWTSVNNVRPLDGAPVGYDTISYYSLAKNLLTVGAVEDVPNYTGPGSVNMTTFSGWGPTDDGRIKPDIVANGDMLWSAYSTADNAYTFSSGTSMSTPNACGSAALIIQHFKSFSGGNAPRADLLKGLIIHTADECGPNPGPDYSFGWGLMNTEAACALISDNAAVGPRRYARMRYGRIMNSDVREWPVKRSTTDPLKVTLCWTDKPGTPPPWSVDPTNKMLVNDLDLRIISPSGTTTYYPWKLNRGSPTAPAVKADNNVDNVEQIVIGTPGVGTYKVRVTHKGVLVDPVNFALVIDNAEPVTPTLSNLTLYPTAMYGGNTADGVVELNMSSFFGTYVTLTDNSVSVTTPATLLIPEGRSIASFGINTLAVTSDKNVTITATVGAVTKTAMLELWAPYALVRVTIGKTRVIGGSTPLFGGVVMNHPAPIEATVNLSSNSSSMTPPAFVLVNMLATGATFNLPTILPTSDHVATLTGTYNGVIKTAQVTIITPPILNAVNVAPNSIVGGTAATGTVYFSKAAPSGGVLITLWDNRPEIVTPANALIPSLQWFGTFTIPSVPVAAPVLATVTATYRGAVRTDTVTVTP